MAEPVIVLLIVIAGASADRPHAAVIGAGIREALGSDARVLYEERDVEPSDEAARTLGAEINVSAVAEMKWLDRERSRANVRVYVSVDDAFVNREVAFKKTDAPEEREKAVGLLVGAMVRAATASNAAPAPIATDLDVTDGVPAAPASPPVAAPVPPPTPATADVPARQPPLAPIAPRSRWRSLDVSATGALSVGGEGSGVGPSVGGQAFIGSPFAIRASAAARFGTIDAAGASSTTLRFGLGAALRVVGADSNDRLAMQVALEAIAVDQMVSRSSPPARRDRWLPGAYATLQVGYRISGAFEPYAGIGVETLFGATPIVLDGTTEAVLSRARLTADAGARIHF